MCAPTTRCARSTAGSTRRAAKAAPKARVDGVLVAEQAQGVETVVGIAQDELFGPVVMFGIGGVFIEILQGRDLPGPALLLGPRRPRCSTSWPARPSWPGPGGSRRPTGRALVDVIMKVQRMAVDLSGQVAELDINPLLAGPSGAVAADALVVLA